MASFAIRNASSALSGSPSVTVRPVEAEDLPGEVEELPFGHVHVPLHETLVRVDRAGGVGLSGRHAVDVGFNLVTAAVPPDRGGQPEQDHEEDNPAGDAMCCVTAFHPNTFAIFTENRPMTCINTIGRRRAEI